MSAPALLSTELDVWVLLPNLCRDASADADKSGIAWYPSQASVKQAIYLCDAKLRAFLKNFYSSDLTYTAVATFPMGPPCSDLENSIKGKERLRLRQVTVGASAVTEMWEL